MGIEYWSDVFSLFIRENYRQIFQIHWRSELKINYEIILSALHTSLYRYFVCLDDQTRSILYKHMNACNCAFLTCQRRTIESHSNFVSFSTSMKCSGYYCIFITFFNRLWELFIFDKQNIDKWNVNMNDNFLLFLFWYLIKSIPIFSASKVVPENSTSRLNIFFILIFQ